MNNLKQNERVDDLQIDGLKIIQNKFGYKFSTDSVLLANFGKARKYDKYLDLCSGSGVVAILFSWKNKIEDSSIIEIQQNLADMAKRSINFNNLNIKVYNDDLNNALNYFDYESFDVITVNPPYNKVDNIEENEISIATHEIKTTLQNICKMSANLLKFGGKLFMVHRADRLAEILFELKKNNLEPKRLQIVYPKVSKDPNLVLVEAKKGASIGIKILNPLILSNDDGQMSDELKRIYSVK